MDEEIERLVVSVRADTQGVSRDVAEMQRLLEGGLGAGVERAGRMIEDALVRALRTGKLGFEDLKRIALAALAEIASAAIRTGIGAILGGGQQNVGLAGLAGLAASVLGGSPGLPGRATGGPVSPGRAFVVGERGPELFVPTSSGSVAPMERARARDVRISIAVNGPAGTAPERLERSSRQVARAVRNALARED
jgi:hypothetical protein